MKKGTFQYNKKFDREFAYDGDDLGAVCAGGGTVFRLWAPFAEKVELCLYEDGGKRMELEAEDSLREADRRLKLQPGERGVWQLELSENLHGVYYDYLLYDNDGIVRTADPYARGCCCNGQRSMVVDLSRTDPDGFAFDRAPEKPAENIIYELHIKDFSYDADSRIPKEYRGKYKAFTVKSDTAGYPVGVEYLQELGVTHVHLLPFYDFGWLDESQDKEEFNWGYDPVNYNVPEGSFATDTDDGSVRIRECKEMVQALHRAGIRVVMDVVYNHTHEAESWLERTAPGYFCRRFPDGELSDGSACGNDMAVGRAMVDNYIVNSVLYWAREYHIDGFRFDLMGLLTTELMNRIRGELDAAFGQGEKLLYGEPWRAKESPMEEGTHAALKDNIAFLDENVAVFSDDIRDVIKGAVFYAEVPGFVNGGKGLENRVLDAVSGWCGSAEGFRPKSCSQIVNYVSAHDNYTLWDKLLLTMRGKEIVGGNVDKEAYLEPYADILAANKLSALMYFTCQGHLFFQAGEEFGRTKFGDENSYRSEPEINMLRWGQTVRFRELVDYYKGLIALRKQLPGLCDKSVGAAMRISGKTVHREKTVSFFVDNRTENGNDTWDTLYVIYNASALDFEVMLPKPETASWETCLPAAEGFPTVSAETTIPRETIFPKETIFPRERWEILADGREANCRKIAGERVTVPAGSGMILGKRARKTLWSLSMENRILRRWSEEKKTVI